MEKKFDLTNLKICWSPWADFKLTFWVSSVLLMGEDWEGGKPKSLRDTLIPTVVAGPMLGLVIDVLSNGINNKRLRVVCCGISTMPLLLSKRIWRLKHVILNRMSTALIFFNNPTLCQTCSMPDIFGITCIFYTLGLWQLERNQSCTKVMWGQVIQTDPVTWPSKVGGYHLNILCKKDEGTVMPNLVALHVTVFPLSEKKKNSERGYHPLGAQVKKQLRVAHCCHPHPMPKFPFQKLL